MNETYSTTFSVYADMTASEIRQRAHDKARAHFGAEPFELDVDVEEVTTHGGTSFSKEVRVRAWPTEEPT